MAAAGNDPYGEIPLEELETAVAIPLWFEQALRGGEPADLRARVQSLPEPVRGTVVRECLQLEAAYRCRQADAAIRRAYDGLLAPGEVDGALDRAWGRGLLSSVADAALPATAFEGLEGTRFGDYEVLKELGRGGMGVVYEARQVSTGLSVALKMIRPRYLASEAARTQFEREGQLAVRINHPGVVRVYAVGRHLGRHFYAMELVAQESLQELLAQDPLPWKEAARLVQRVAEAVAYVHSRHGLVHRDLKPANILLADDGRPRVADFGLALPLVGEGSAGAAAEVVGTPGYMAPEQAAGKAGEVGPPADIYALGAVLYAAVCQRPPLTGQGSRPAQDNAPADEPVPLRQVCPQVPPDLEAICRKCLASTLDRRYQTAQQVADDLERLLGHRPTRARPASLPRRGWLWCRRNPFIASLVGLLLLVCGAAYLMTRAAHNRAVQSEARREQTAIRARLSLATLDDLAERLAASQARLSVGLGDVNRDLLEALLQHYEAMLTGAGDDPEALAGKGRILNKLTMVFRVLGRADKALNASTQAETIFDHLRQTQAVDPLLRFGLAVALSNKAAIQGQQGQFKDALANAGLAEPLLAGLVSEFPDQPDYPFRLALCENNRALCLRYLGQADRARAEFGKAVDRLAGLIKAFPQDRRRDLYREWQVRTLNNLADTLAQAGAPGEAEAPQREAVRLAEALAAEQPLTPDYQDALAACLANLGPLLESRGNLAEAETTHQRTRSVYGTLAAQFPAAQEYRWGVPLATFQLGSTRERQGNLVAAEADLRQAVKGYQRLTADYPTTTDIAKERGLAHVALARVLMRRGKAKEAEDYADKAVALLETLAGSHPDAVEFRQALADALSQLGVVRAGRGRLADAADCYRRAVAAVAQLATDRPGEAQFQRLLGQSCFLHAGLFVQLGGPGHAAEAVGLLRRAREAGFFGQARHVEELEKSDQPAPLRGRPDYQQIVTELKAPR
jgi:tetratricopeptide (TPR) repeat protein/predicted Ser/Thr protein kinase